MTKIDVFESSLSIKSQGQVTSGSENYFKIQFSFDKTWEGYIKYAVFYQSLKEPKIEVEIDETTLTAEIPNEMLVESLPLFVGVYGIKDEAILSTDFAKISTRYGAFSGNIVSHSNVSAALVRSVNTKIKLIRENENGEFEYSTDGENWKIVSSSSGNGDVNYNAILERVTQLEKNLSTTSTALKQETTNRTNSDTQLTNRISTEEKARKSEISRIETAINNETDNRETAVSSLRSEIYGAGYITKVVDDLINYYKKSELYTKEEINSIISGLQGGGLTLEKVNSLPSTGNNKVIYLVPVTGSTNNFFEEYIWVNSKWELIGSTAINLANYYTKAEIDSIVSEYLKKTAVDSAISETSTNPVQNKAVAQALKSKADTSSLSKVATSGSYNDLTNKPNLFSGDYKDLTNKPTLFSGSYNDLTDKPTIPTAPTIDTTLSTTSENPVQNKVVTEKFAELEAKAESQTVIVQWDGNSNIILSDEDYAILESSTLNKIQFVYGMAMAFLECVSKVSGDMVYYGTGYMSSNGLMPFYATLGINSSKTAIVVGYGTMPILENGFNNNFLFPPTIDGVDIATVDNLTSKLDNPPESAPVGAVPTKTADGIEWKEIEGGGSGLTVIEKEFQLQETETASFYMATFNEDEFALLTDTTVIKVIRDNEDPVMCYPSEFSPERGTYKYISGGDGTYIWYLAIMPPLLGGSGLLVQSYFPSVALNNTWEGENDFVGGLYKNGVEVATLDDVANAGGGGGGSVTVDSELSATSENPVQNKVVTAEFEKKITAPPAKTAIVAGDEFSDLTFDTTKDPHEWIINTAATQGQQFVLLMLENAPIGFMAVAQGDVSAIMDTGSGMVVYVSHTAPDEMLAEIGATHTGWQVENYSLLDVPIIAEGIASGEITLPFKASIVAEAQDFIITGIAGDAILQRNIEGSYKWVGVGALGDAIKAANETTLEIEWGGQAKSGTFANEEEKELFKQWTTTIDLVSNYAHTRLKPVWGFSDSSGVYTYAGFIGSNSFGIPRELVIMNREADLNYRIHVLAVADTIGQNTWKGTNIFNNMVSSPNGYSIGGNNPVKWTGYYPVTLKANVTGMTGAVDLTLPQKSGTVAIAEDVPNIYRHNIKITIYTSGSATSSTYKCVTLYFNFYDSQANAYASAGTLFSKILPANNAAFAVSGDYVDKSTTVSMNTYLVNRLERNSSGDYNAVYYESVSDNGSTAQSILGLTSYLSSAKITDNITEV